MTYPSDWQAWATGVLAGVQAPASSENLHTLWDWSVFESGQSVMRWNNPLNTTQDAPGAVNENSVGVKGYPDVLTGITATVQTLKNGRYPAIVQDLQGSVPQADWGNACQDLGVWGSGCNWLGTNQPASGGGGGSSTGTTTLTSVPNPVDFGHELGTLISSLWNAPGKAAQSGQALQNLLPTLQDIAWRTFLPLLGTVLIIVGIQILLVPVQMRATEAVVGGPGGIARRLAS
jgi:hypothetical protein